MQALSPSSGTTNFNPSLGDLILDAFARVQIRPTSLTADHFFQARLSASLLQSELSNVGVPLLFLVKEVLIPLTPGVSSYTLPANVIAPLDGFIRQYYAGNPQNFTPIITGTAGSTLAQITQPLHSLAAGSMVFFATAVAASGQVIQGTYLVTDTVDPNNYHITVPVPMDGTNSVALPVFTATLGSTNIAINLPNHNLALGQNFYCNVPVTVGGLQLSGSLPVTSVIDQNNFTIGIGGGASASGTATMNGGLVQTQSQLTGVDPFDRILFPISRTDYVSQPDKGPNLQFMPTTFWFSRTINPTINFWNAPDDYGPYICHLYTMSQPEDMVVEGGVGVNYPFRWLAVIAAGIAKNLARKYPPHPDVGVTVKDLVDEYKLLLQDALMEDIERGPSIFISPGVSGYFR